MWDSFQLYMLRGQRLSLADALDEAMAMGDRERASRLATHLAELNIRIAKREAKRDKWYYGYGVYREEPWHLAGFYNERRSAERRIKKVGPAYQIAYGKVRRNTDEFAIIDKNRGLDVEGT